MLPPASAEWQRIMAYLAVCFFSGVTGVPPVNMGVFDVCSFAAKGDWGGFV